MTGRVFVAPVRPSSCFEIEAQTTAVNGGRRVFRGPFRYLVRDRGPHTVEQFLTTSDGVDLVRVMAWQPQWGGFVPELVVADSIVWHSDFEAPVALVGVS